MLKQLLRDSVVYALGRAVTALVGLVLLPIYTAYLAPAEFGLYDMGFLVVTLAGLVVALEISQGAARHYCAIDDAAARRRYFSTALFFTAGAFTVFCGIGLLVAPLLARPILGPDASSRSLMLVFAAAGTVALFRLGLAQLRWLLRPWAFLSCSLVQVSCTAGLSVWLVLHGHGPHGLFVGMIAGNAVGFVVTLVLGRVGLGLSWSSASMREMLVFSVPLVTSSAAVFVATYIDRIAIKELMTMGDLGRYGVAYRFAAAIELVMTGFNTALMPLIYTHHDEPETPSELATLLRRIFVLGALIIIGLAGFANDALRVLVSSEYESAAGLIAVLAAGVFITKLQSVAPGLWIAKRTGIIAVINVLIAVANLGMNFVLIPVLGVQGAALATLASATLGFALNMSASQSHYPVPHGWLRLGLGVLVTGVAVAILGDQSQQFEPLRPIGLALKAATALTATVALVMVTLERGELRAIVGGPRRRQPPA